MTPSLYPPINPELEPWISATQISTFELCNRKWAWKWLERVYAPPSKFAQLGIDTHGRLEDWLKYGVVPDGDSQDCKLARAMIPYLPPPQVVDPKNVERDELIVVEDVLFNVKIDLFMPEITSWDGALRARTYDHKTSGDPERYAPQPSQIQFDPQAALYSAWTIIHTTATTLDLQWNYVKTKGAIKVHPVCATVTDEMITPRMQANIHTGRAIKQHFAHTKRALDVVHDARACDEFGGCPYKEGCGLNARERIVSIMSDFKNQPTTQQFLAGIPPNGQAVNPPPFAPPPQAPGGFAAPPAPPQPGFAPPQQAPAFAPPPQQGFAPPPQQGFAPPPQAPQQGFAPPQQAPAFAPPQAPPQYAPPPQQGFAPPQQGFAPPQQGFAPPPQSQAPAAQPPPFAPPPAPAAAAPSPPAERGPGRPKQSKEYDMTGAWVMFMSSAMQRAQDVSSAAQMADAAVAELKARQ